MSKVFTGRALCSASLLDRIEDRTNLVKGTIPITPIKSFEKIRLIIYRPSLREKVSMFLQLAPSPLVDGIQNLSMAHKPDHSYKVS